MRLLDIADEFALGSGTSLNPVTSHGYISAEKVTFYQLKDAHPGEHTMVHFKNTCYLQLYTNSCLPNFPHHPDIMFRNRL